MIEILEAFREVLQALGQALILASSAIGVTLVLFGFTALMLGSSSQRGVLQGISPTSCFQMIFGGSLMIVIVAVLSIGTQQTFGHSPREFLNYTVPSNDRLPAQVKELMVFIYQVFQLIGVYFVIRAVWMLGRSKQEQSGSQKNYGGWAIFWTYLAGVCLYSLDSVVLGFANLFTLGNANEVAESIRLFVPN